MTWLTLIPAAGRNSYVVTTGPGWYSVTSPSTPNSAHFDAIKRPVSASALRSTAVADGSRFSSSETGGSA